MKLREGFITYTTGDEQILVATGSAVEHFRGMVRSNKAAAHIIDCLRQEQTLEQLVDAMAARFDAPRDVLRRDTLKTLDTLRSVGALDE